MVYAERLHISTFFWVIMSRVVDPSCSGRKDMQLDEEHEPEVCTFLEENNQFVSTCKTENLQLIIELEINLNNGSDIYWQVLLTTGSQL